MKIMDEIIKKQLDLEQKHESLRFEVIEMLVKKYPNDYDLGAAVREFVKMKKNTN
jgi:hypothetical protein